MIYKQTKMPGTIMLRNATNYLSIYRLKYILQLFYAAGTNEKETTLYKTNKRKCIQDYNINFGCPKMSTGTSVLSKIN